ncbi:MAG: RagB/SusD family nutrient uptake outer membrane protein [Pseudopedobacter saltans]|uniref:RagB/SusD family nutrient uptake outer membrane protein n=1 Tax=Pseudopedobacter saltans TaxID=151895 RepID=A0A2W5GUZ4_9SPHI|nr:MAG: RagB/SusD family nutrient uptake outer membrane protein [Pseudopedobacter saltans]
MKIRKIFVLTIVVTLSCNLLSCSKYLNVVPDNVATIEYAFRNRNEAENYLFACYNQMQTLQSLVADPGFCTSGELIYKYPQTYNPLGGTSAPFQLIRGFQNPQTPSLDNYSDLYIALNRCNTFLENINLPPDLTLAEKVRWIAEVKFLKAYYYFYLVRKYGPVPLERSNIPVSASTDEVRVPRFPTDSIFNYVFEQLNEAIANLPPAIGNVGQEYGRATQIMALALKAKAMVTWASPLFNGDPDEARLKNQDGTALFPSSFSSVKWDSAVIACKNAIDACDAQSISLYRYVAQSSGVAINDSISRLLSIQAPINFPQTNLISERIWPGNRAAFSQVYYAPTLNTASQNNRSIDADATFAVPINTTELFYTKNGVPINEDKNWDYAGRYSLTTGDAANKFFVRQSYQTVKMHLNRESRFYADLAFDGGVWYGYGTVALASLQYLISSNQNSNLTGYWAKKLVPYTTGFTGTGPLAQTTYYPPVMRLSDLYLLYAEALNESQGPSAEAYKYIDLVRDRAGLMGVVQSWAANSTTPDKPSTKDGLRSIIHQERRIELCFEGQAGWDLRRWKEYLPVMSAPIQGWNYVGSTTAAAYYQRTVNLFIPNLGIKDYFWPFNASVLLNNPKIVQNLYW